MITPLCSCGFLAAGFLVFLTEDKQRLTWTALHGKSTCQCVCVCVCCYLSSKWRCTCLCGKPWGGGKKGGPVCKCEGSNLTELPREP